MQFADILTHINRHKERMGRCEFYCDYSNFYVRQTLPRLSTSFYKCVGPELEDVHLISKLPKRNCKIKDGPKSQESFESQVEDDGQHSCTRFKIVIRLCYNLD